MSFASGYSRLVSLLYRQLWLGSMRSAAPAVPAGTLILAAHYNGAIDGCTYPSQLPPCRAVVSSQWHRAAIGRWLLPGIAVTRAKDPGSGGGNAGAFRQMLAELKRGGRLLFFPEGTSRLGRERLPVQPGTLLLLRGYRSVSRTPQVVFVAACYHDPTRWKSAVTLGWVGPLPLPANRADDEAWVRGRLLAAQDLAYAQPAPRPGGWTALAALLALPYLPLWALVAWLARRTADEDNVIALWKFIYGTPLTLILLGLYTGLAALAGVPAWLPLTSLAGGWLLWNR